MGNSQKQLFGVSDLKESFYVKNHGKSDWQDFPFNLFKTTFPTFRLGDPKRLMVNDANGAIEALERNVNAELLLDISDSLLSLQSESVRDYDSIKDKFLTVASSEVSLRLLENYLIQILENKKGRYTPTDQILELNSISGLLYYIFSNVELEKKQIEIVKNSCILISQINPLENYKKKIEPEIKTALGVSLMRNIRIASMLFDLEPSSQEVVENQLYPEYFTPYNDIIVNSLITSENLGHNEFDNMLVDYIVLNHERPDFPKILAHIVTSILRYSEENPLHKGKRSERKRSLYSNIFSREIIDCLGEYSYILER